MSNYPADNIYCWKSLGVSSDIEHRRMLIIDTNDIPETELLPAAQAVTLGAGADASSVETPDTEWSS